MESYNYNGFVYQKDEESELGVIEEHAVAKPDLIYKFYTLNDYSVDGLINGYFYASHPFDLNDIMDSSRFLIYALNPVPLEIYIGLMDKEFERETEKYMKFYHEDILNNCKGFISLFYEVLTNKFGVVSMTGVENDTLMWPHYTQETGFQLKFNTKELEKSIKAICEREEGGECLSFSPINYSENLEPIDISKFSSMHIPLNYITNVKSDKWKYENEWRFVISKFDMGIPYSKLGFVSKTNYKLKDENRYLYYNKYLVEEITVGYNFFNGNRFNIKKINDVTFRVKPIKSDKHWDYQNLLNLLNYVVDNLKDKLYQSVIGSRVDENSKPFLVRSKEKFEIVRKEEGVFELTRIPTTF